MITLSGAQVWPPGHEEGDDGYPSLTDIGRALGATPRFRNQLERGFYPVLCHSNVVTALVPNISKPYAHIHDAPETTVADTPTTWKTPEMKAREEHLLMRITKGNGLIWPWPEDIAKDVETADIIALAAEAMALKFPDAGWFLKKFFPDYDNDSYIREVIQLAIDMTEAQFRIRQDYIMNGSFAGAYYQREFQRLKEATHEFSN